MEKNILDVMAQEYGNLTASEKKIADYILLNQQKCIGIGITELASVCGVAVSTLSLFCRKLKLAGFNDFKMELAKLNLLGGFKNEAAGSTEIMQEDSAAEIARKACLKGKNVLENSYRMLNPEAVNKAVELIEKANRVLILGQGNHSAVASMTWTQLMMISAKFQIVHDSHMQTVAAANLTTEDVVIYFSYSGATNEIMDAAETIKKVGAKLILITHFERSPAAEYADVVLIFGQDEEPLRFGSLDAVFSQLYVVEVLLYCYCIRNWDSVSKQRELIGKELSRKQL